MDYKIFEFHFIGFVLLPFVENVYFFPTGIHPNRKYRFPHLDVWPVLPSVRQYHLNMETWIGHLAHNYDLFYSVVNINRNLHYLRIRQRL